MVLRHCMVCADDDDGVDGGRKLLNDDDGVDGGRKLLASESHPSMHTASHQPPRQLPLCLSRCRAAHPGHMLSGDHQAQYHQQSFIERWCGCADDDDGVDGGRKLLANDDDGVDGGCKLLSSKPLFPPYSIGVSQDQAAA